MTGNWTYLIGVIFVMVCAIGFRILMELFCIHAERKIRLICVAGMMFLYTIIITWGLYFTCELLIDGNFQNQTATITDYRNLICIMFPIFNLGIGGLILFYCAHIKKHVLSNREKVLLMDL